MKLLSSKWIVAIAIASIGVSVGVFQNCAGAGSTAGNPLNEPPQPPPDGVEPISLLSEYTRPDGLVSFRFCSSALDLRLIPEQGGRPERYFIRAVGTRYDVDPEGTFLGYVLEFAEEDIVPGNYHITALIGRRCDGINWAAHLVNTHGTFTLSGGRGEFFNVRIEQIPNANGDLRIVATAPVQQLMNDLANVTTEEDFQCTFWPSLEDCRLRQ